jgi:hypothetical protein
MKTKTIILTAVASLCLAGAAFAAVPVSARRPTQTTLQATFNIPVKSAMGKEIGSVTAKGGTVVNIEHVRKDVIMISLGETTAWIPRTSTDFDQRLAAFKQGKLNAAAHVQDARLTQAAAFQRQKQDAGADFQSQHASYSNPLDQPAYDQSRSVVDYYDWLGRRYHIGAYGQRIYQ